MDNHVIPNEAMVRESIEQKLIRYFGVKPDEANEEQIYKATVMSVKDVLTEKRSVFREKVKKQRPKKVYYLCMEFLMGRQLRNNLMNLGIDTEYRKVLADMGFDLDKIYEFEPDPGLGNGGLGRLAACFLDSL
ncbi:MAG: glycogen/starch/alpha-glucan phosphorylase, partial [Clostridia bacterium]|nr:glycogen/starch/alpha-glucan phosphorylase [Clostridia bacterium]